MFEIINAPRTPSGGQSISATSPLASRWINDEFRGVTFIWAIASLLALAFVVKYAFAVPFGDEWLWMDRITGAEPVTLSWLWSSHGEHRIFLPRLIYILLGEATGYNFRAGVFYDVAILIALSLGFLLVIKRARGRSRICDAFFPLVLLNWGQYENLMWGFQVNFFTSVVLEGIVLLIVYRCEATLSLKQAAAAFVCLLALGSCGSYGIVYLPTMACWLAFAAVLHWRSDEKAAKRNAILIALMAATLVSFVAFYLYGLPRGSVVKSPYAIGINCFQMLSGGIGDLARDFWPFSGAITLLVIATLIWINVRAWLRRPTERIRAIGFLAFLAGVFLLGLAIGVGRATPRGGFEFRYYTLAIPLLLVLYLQLEAFGGKTLSRRAPTALFVIACLVYSYNLLDGARRAETLSRCVNHFVHDMRNGLPPEALAVRYGDMQGQNWSNEDFLLNVARLQKCGIVDYPSQGPNAFLTAYAVVPCNGKSSPVKIDCIMPGEVFRMPFSVQTSGELRRIDVGVNVGGRNAKALRRLGWTLYRAGAGEKSVATTGDVVEPYKDVCDGQISVFLSRTPVRQGEQYELQLTLPAEEKTTGDKPSVYLEVPYYPTKENLTTPKATPSAAARAFVFIEPDGK